MLLAVVSVVLMQICVQVHLVHGSCQFDASLQGKWQGTDGRQLTFTADRLKGFKLTVPNLSESDFVCVSSSTQNSVTKYLLRAVDSVTIFNIRPDLYMCIEEENGIFKHYSLDTTVNPLLQDHLYGTALMGVPDEQVVCNAPDEDKYSLQKISEVIPKRSFDDGVKEQKLKGLLSLLLRELEKRNT